MKPSARLFIVCLTVFAAMTASRSALAQGSARDEEALIARGLQLREKGDDEAALREFRRAHELSHSGRALAQVALAEQALGSWVDAEVHLTEAMRHEREPWVARNLRLFRQALTDIQSHLGSLELSGGVAGAEVLINGAHAGTLPMDVLRVPAGSIALEVRAPNHLPVLRTVLVPAGGLAREPVALVAIPSPGPAPPARPPAHVDSPPPSQASPAGTAVAAPPSSGGWSGRRKLGAGMVAGGVASLAGAMIFQVIREVRAAHFNDAGCGVANGETSGPPAAACASRYEDVQRARNFVIGGYAAAAILGGVGALLWRIDF